MGLFRRRHDRIERVRDREGHRCGSARSIVIIAARLVGDRPAFEALRAAVYQGNAHSKLVFVIFFDIWGEW
jgi:hypothetical protein